jgi:hypothetical protein
VFNNAKNPRETGDRVSSKGLIMSLISLGLAWRLQALVFNPASTQQLVALRRGASFLRGVHAHQGAAAHGALTSGADRVMFLKVPPVGADQWALTSGR